MLILKQIYWEIHNYTFPDHKLRIKTYLRNAENVKFENEQRHLFEVNTFAHKDDVWPELRKNGKLTITALHCQSVEPRD